MSASFELNHDRLAANPKFATLVRGELNEITRIDSKESFNQYCRKACRAWQRHLDAKVGQTSPLFRELLDRIATRADGTIPTSWGGVVVTLHEHPKVEKYLVIRQGGYLALEKHAEKDEHLEVREGAGLILSRQEGDQPLAVEMLLPGSRFHFAPGMEHCIVGTEDLLVFERSTDPKGMDQDLIFIYEPEATA